MLTEMISGSKRHRGSVLFFYCNEKIAFPLSATFSVVALTHTLTPCTIECVAYRSQTCSYDFLLP